MPSPVTLAYSRRLVARLLADETLTLAPDATEDALVHALAEGLTGLPQHAGLITNTTRVLLASPLVDELFVDDEELQEIVNALRQ